MGVGAGVYMYNVVIKKFTFAISSPDVFLYFFDIIIIRPHCSTTYVDAAYCYQLSSVVCRSFCQSITLMRRAKRAALMEMSYGLRIWVGPKETY